jgi:iron complex transport system permease protein
MTTQIETKCADNIKKPVSFWKKTPTVTLILFISLILLFIISFWLGRYGVSPAQVIQIFLSKVFPITPTWPDIMETVIFDIRLPRILAAILIGAALATAGTSFQGLFRNPLVSPQILGVTSGAGFGAAMAIVISGNPAIIQISAFGVAIAAVATSWLISSRVRGNPTLTLVLAGMAIGSLFSALTSLMQYMADPEDELPEIVFWLMGSLNSIYMKDLIPVAIIIIVGITVLMLIRWRINVLSMGEEEAKALGVNTTQLRAIIIVCASLITAAAVSISGMIGWVGLVMPHIGRMLVGPCNKKLLPVSALLGGIYMLLIDNICRTALSVEIPIGILTAIVGVPFFLYLIRRGKQGWV